MDNKRAVNRFLMTFLLVLGLLALCAVPSHGQCGVERTPVKTLKDPDAKAVHIYTYPMTVQALRLMPKPAKWGNSMARLDEEKFVYEVQAQVIGYKYEADGDRDYHVVLSTPGKPAETMILEIPHPDCGRPEDKQRFSELRAFIDSLGPKPSPKFVTLPKPVPITATGVVFFDKIHGQKGVAPNGVELHPGLKLTKR